MYRTGIHVFRCRNISTAQKYIVNRTEINVFPSGGHKNALSIPFQITFNIFNTKLKSALLFIHN